MTASITIVGRIVGDIESKQAGQSTVTRLRIPTDSGFGERKSTTWWSVEVWGKRGDTLAQHCGAGDIVYVTGEPCVREYERKDGTKGYSCEIKNAGWSFVPKPSQQGQQGQQSDRAPAPSYGKPAASGGASYDDGDVPF
mgnify:FL=1